MVYEHVQQFILVSIIAAAPFALAWVLTGPIANYRGICSEVVPRQWLGLAVFGLGVLAPTAIYGAIYQSYWALVMAPITAFSLLLIFSWQRRIYNRLHGGEQWSELSPDGPFFPIARDHLYPSLKERFGPTTKR